MFTSSRTRKRERAGRLLQTMLGPLSRLSLIASVVFLSGVAVGAGAERSSSAPPPTEAVAPATAGPVLRLWAEVRAIDAWRESSFKPAVWRRLADLLAERARSGLSLDRLVENEFRCLDDSPAFREERQKMKAALSRLKDTATNEISLEAGTAELVWTARQLWPTLAVELRTKVEAGSDWLRTATVEQMESVVVDAIHRRQTFVRRLNKLRLLASQPEPLCSLLGIDTARYARWINELEPPNDDPRVGPRSMPAGSLLQEVENELVRLKVRFEGLEGSAAKMLEKLARALPAEYEVPIGDGASLCYRMIWPPAGTSALPAAEVSLRLPRGPNFADLPLGIRIDEVEMDAAGRPKPAARPHNTISFQNLDSLRESLRQLGLPAEIELVGADPAPGGFGPSKVAIQARFALPLIERVETIMIVIGEGSIGLRASANDLSTAFSDALFAQLQKRFETALGKMGAISFPGGKKVSVEFGFKGDWAKRNLQITGRFDLGKLAKVGQKPVKLEATLDFQKDGKGWRLVPYVPAVPGAILDELKSDALAQLLSWLPFDAEGIKMFASSFSLVDVRYDADLHQFQGNVRFKCGLEALPHELTVKFSVKLAPALRVSFEDAGVAAFRAELVAVKDRLIAQMRDSLAGRIKSSIEQLLQNRPSVSLAGMQVVVTEAKAERGRYRLTVEALAGSKSLRVRNLYLIALEGIENGHITNPKFDFSECIFEPHLKDFLAGIAGLQGMDWLEISQVRALRDGVAFHLEAKPASLGFSVPLGEFEFGSGEFRWDSRVFRAAVVKTITERLINSFGPTGRDLTIGGIGALRGVRVSPETSLEPFVLVVTGRLSLADILEVGVKADSQGKVDLTDFNALVGKIEGQMKKLIPAGAGVDVKDLKAITQPPYGLRFDLRVNASPFDGLKVDGVELRQDGLKLPASLTIPFPQKRVPLGAGFFIADPKIRLPLRAGGSLGAEGDVTFAELQQVAKIVSTLTQEGSLEKLRFKLNGQLVLLGVLGGVPIFEMVGIADFGELRMENQARTVGLLDQFLSVSGLQLVDGKARLIEQDAQISLFGFKVLSSRGRIQFAPDGLRIGMSVAGKIPIASVTFSLEGTLPNFRDAKMEAGVEAKIGGFTLGGAGVNVTWGSAILKFSVVGVDIEITVPAADALTSGLVWDAIRKIFDFDFDFSQITRRKIVINLIPPSPPGSPAPKADPLGKGEPPPQGNRAAAPDNTHPNAPEKTDKEAEARQLAGATPLGDRPAAPPPGPISAVQVRTQARTYLRGNASIEFVEEPGRPGLFRMQTTQDGVVQSRGHYLIPASVRDHINGTTILRWLELKTDTAIKCTYGNHHPTVEGVLTIRESDGRMAVAWFGETGEIRELDMSTAPLKAIMPKGVVGKFWDWIKGTAQTPEPLAHGDILLLEAWALSQVPLAASTPKLESYERQDIADWLSREKIELTQTDGYFLRTLEQGNRRSASFQFRDSAARLEANEGDPLYPVFVDGGNDPFLRRVFARYAEAYLRGRTVRILPSENPKDEFTLLIKSPAPENRAELIVLRRAEMDTMPPVQLLPADALDRLLVNSPNQPILAGKFLRKIPEVLATRTFRQLRVGSVEQFEKDPAGRQLQKYPRGIFVGAIDDKEGWKLLALHYDPSTRSFESNAADGAIVATRYQRIDVQVAGAPHKLETKKEREWFVERLLDDDAGWETNLKFNPLNLLFPE